MDLRYMQVPCQNPVTGDDFTRGVQDYVFSVGGKTALIPSKCYFRIEVELTGPGGVNRPVVADQLALADNFAAGLYKEAYFKAGQQDISSNSVLLAQSHSLRARLTKPGAWLNTTGRSAYYNDADFQSRVKRTAWDTSTVNAAIDAVNDTCTMTAAPGGSTVVGVNTDFLRRLVPGDALLIIGLGPLSPQQVVIVKSIADATNLVVTSETAVSVALSTIFKINNYDEGEGRNRVYVIYQPPLGIFDYDEKPLGAGDYRISLNPNADFKKACVESRGVAKNAPVDYDFKIKGVTLYVATVKMDLSATGVADLHLMESRAYPKDVTTNDAILDFTIPSSTYAITVLLQSSEAGSTTIIPSTMFKMTGGGDLNLKSLQLTYANIVKPTTRWSSEFTDGSNLMAQRYHDSFSEAGRLWSPGGTESMADFLKRGAFYHFSWDRDRSDRSTQLQIQADFSSVPVKSNLVVVAHYTKKITITTTNGFISEIVAVAV